MNGLKFNNKIIKKISGPISMAYMIPIEKNLPRFLLFGDLHGSYNNMCKDEEEDTYVISDQKFLDVFDVEGVHFFLEDVFFYNSRKTDIKIGTGGNLADVILKHARKCYKNKRIQDTCTTKYIKWHYTDIRHHSLEEKQNLNFAESLNLLNGLTQRITLMNLTSEEKKTINIPEIKKLFADLIRYTEPYDSFIDCFINNSDLIKKQEAKSPVKLLSLLTRFYKLEEDKIFMIYPEFKSFLDLKKYIRELNIHLDEIFKADSKHIEFSQKQKFSIFHTVLSFLKSVTVDIYAIQRSFKYNSKLNIFFLGASHIEKIKLFLLSTSLYKLEYENDENDHIPYKDTKKIENALLVQKNISNFTRCLTINKHVKIDVLKNSYIDLEDVARRNLIDVLKLKKCIKQVSKQMNISKKQILIILTKNKRYIQKTESEYKVFDENDKIPQTFNTLEEAQQYVLFMS